MKKRILTLTMCIALALTSLIGCSNEEKEPEIIEEVKNEKQDILTLNAKDFIEDIEFSKIKDLSNLTISDDMIIKEINERLKTYSAYKRADGGIVEKTSIVNIDFEGSIDGIKFEGGTIKSFTLDIANSTLIEGIASGLVGHEVGEELDIKVTFPSNYNSNATYVDKNGKTQKLAEKDAVFHVKINFLYGDKVTTYDDLTDQVIQDWFDSNVKDKKEFLEKQKQNKLENMILKYELEIWDTLVENIKIKEDKKDEVEKFIEAEYLYEIDFSKKIAEYNKISFEEYIKTNGFTTEEEFKKSQKENSEYIVKQNLILAYIAQENSLILSDEEYNIKALELGKQYGYDTLENFEKDYGKIQINEYLHYYIVSDFILEANGLKK